MRTREEIEKSTRLAFELKDQRGCMGTIVLPRWQGSFVCGYDENGWEHVSVAPYKRSITPSWDDMCMVKDIFWGEEEEAIQIHPKKSKYVNIVENCLHLWRHKDMVLPK